MGGLRYDEAELRAAYDATPAQPTAMAFWAEVAERLDGRTAGAVYRECAHRRRWPARVLEVRCSACGRETPASGAAVTICRECVADAVGRR